MSILRYRTIGAVSKSNDTGNQQVQLSCILDFVVYKLLQIDLALSRYALPKSKILAIHVCHRSLNKINAFECWVVTKDAYNSTLLSMIII